MHKIGIALGGGGVRGFAHLGVLQALSEKGIKPDAISGTSAGAIVGSFIAAGNSPEETLKILQEKDLFGYSKIHWPKDGLFSLDGLEEMLNEEFTQTKIEELDLPLTLTASNLNHGHVEYLSEGPLVKSILASASVPFVFKPVEMNGYKYSDGGLCDNLPIHPLTDSCEKIIAVSISPLEETDELENLLQIATRTFQMSVNAQNNELKESCTLYIEPDHMRRYGMFELEKADELFELGYDYVKKMEINFD